VNVAVYVAPLFCAARLDKLPPTTVIKELVSLFDAGVIVNVIVEV
jgi:hypothetical protein